MTLAVRRMPSPHTADHVRELVDTILEEWDIPTSKVTVVVTNNGSNMVAAFRTYVASPDDSQEDGGESEDDSESEVSQDDDFDECEEEHDLAFTSMRRIGCFTHTLQLVAKKFDRRVNCSTKVTERLINACGKKILNDCPTRWSSTFLMIERLLDVRDPLTKVLEEAEWDNLAASEWKSLWAIKNLLQPLAEFTSLLSGEEFTTISSALPTIMDLNLHLEHMKSHSDNLIGEVARTMQTDLRRRFRKFTDPGDSQYNPLYIIATALDPRYKVLLNPGQTASARVHLLKEIKDMVDHDSSSSSECDSP